MPDILDHDLKESMKTDLMKSFRFCTGLANDNTTSKQDREWTARSNAALAVPAIVRGMIDLDKLTADDVDFLGAQLKILFQKSKGVRVHNSHDGTSDPDDNIASTNFRKAAGQVASLLVELEDYRRDKFASAAPR